MFASDASPSIKQTSAAALIDFFTIARYGHLEKDMALHLSPASAPLSRVLDTEPAIRLLRLLMALPQSWGDQEESCAESYNKTC
jgi:hypothetical protein